MKIADLETNNVYCVDCYQAIKGLPDKSKERLATMIYNKEVKNILEERIKDNEYEIKDLTAFLDTVKVAIEEHILKKYKPLEKALEEFGNWGEIHNAFGYDFIAKAKFEKLNALYEQRQSDKTEMLAQRFMANIQERIDRCKSNIANAKKELKWYEEEEDENI